MSIVRFRRDQFELALPAVRGQVLWQSLGVRNGEYCYIVPVKPGVLLYIRSSIAADGIAADVAEDSIRCWIAGDDKGTPLGSKDQRWIARTKGWDKRMIETLRVLWRIGMQITDCPECKTLMQALKCKTSAKPENVGRWFLSCRKCERWDRWLTDPKENAA